MTRSMRRLLRLSRSPSSQQTNVLPRQSQAPCSSRKPSRLETHHVVSPRRSAADTPVMRLADDGTLLLSPSDLSGHLACPHLTTLNLRVQRGELERPLDDAADDQSRA